MSFRHYTIFDWISLIIDPVIYISLLFYACLLFRDSEPITGIISISCLIYLSWDDSVQRWLEKWYN